MNTFYKIIQKHCKATNIFFPNDENNKDAIFKFCENVYNYELKIEKSTFIKFIFYHSIINSMHYKFKKCYYITRYPKAKMDALDNILNNIFLSDNQKEEVLNTFAKIQRTYHAFSRFAFIYKVKKAKMQITTDLGLNPIDTSKNNVIQIYQNKTNYLFIIQDLINIIETSLSNSSDFFSDPLPIKNPYNNMHFSIAILHHIYFFIKYKNYIMPHLFHLYFLENFNLKKFSVNNESTIRDIAIKNHVFNTPPSFLYNNAIRMLNDNRHTNKFHISYEFPKDKLVNILRPYLYLEHMSRLSLNTDKRHDCLFLLQEQLNIFYSFNSQFGRKIINHSDNTVTFNTRHIVLKLNTLKKKWGPGTDEDIDSDSDSDADWILMKNALIYTDNAISQSSLTSTSSPLILIQQNMSSSSVSTESSSTQSATNYDVYSSDDEFYFGTPSPFNLLNHI